MLETIHSTQDLRALPLSGQVALAEEIRREIVRVVAKNGGHLSSNLGTVELTIALHNVYDPKTDRILFDVGHQSYTHKLLTGRYERFDTLRQMGGLSGFMRPGESACDPCVTGHASSGISVGLGMARARDLKGTNEQVVVVVGDGALTGGLCYEALNDAGQAKTGLVVVLNDNEMSISRNVGALGGYLTGLRQSTPYRSFKRGVRGALNRLPRMRRALERLRDALKRLFVDDQFFSALGFEYQGPIDGHDIKRLTRVLTRAKEAGRPVLVHVATRKGTGYAPAMEAPDRFHGTPPFDPETGAPLAPPLPLNGAAVAETLITLAEKDARVVGVIAAMGEGTGLSAFGRRFPERLFDVGIAEEHAVAMAAGLAARGMRPYVAIYSTFLQRAYDEILEDVCLPRLPVTFLIDRAGLVGSDGVTHQGAFDLSFLRAMPGMTVASPRDVRELTRLLEMEHEGPLAIRYPRDAEDMGPRMARKGPLAPGAWEELATGSDGVILAVGRMVGIALQAAIELHGVKISVGVVDARFVKPLDEAMLMRLAQTSPLLVTLEEGVLSGGFGDAVAAKIAVWGARARMLRLGMPDAFVEQGSIAEQARMCGLTPAQVAESVKRAIQEVKDGNAQG